MQESLGWKPPELLLYRGTIEVGQKHFNGESTVKIKSIPKDDPIRKFCQVEEDQWDLFPEGVLEKLVYGRRLVPESKIMPHYLFQERLQTLEQKIEGEDLFELIRTDHVELVEAKPETVKRTVEAFVDNFRNAPWLLATKRRERLYPSTIIDVLAKCDPLRVDLDWDYLKRFQRRPKSDTPYERALDRLTEWFEENREPVLAGTDWHLPPTDIIADDPIIVRQCKLTTKSMVIIVTNDRKLVRLVENEVPRLIVGRISVEDWVNVDADEGAFLRVFESEWPTIIPEIIVDQGALETFLLKTDITGTRYPEWNDSTLRPPPLGQQDIYDVFLPPRVIDRTNLWSIVKVNTRRSANEWRSIVARG